MKFLALEETKFRVTIEKPSKLNSAHKLVKAAGQQEGFSLMNDEL